MPETRESLLIVDDEPSIRMLLLQILTENGYAARSTTNGFSALVEISHEVPDFLISDLSMPGMSGFELLMVVRGQFPSIRVIAMSGAFSGDKIPSGVLADGYFEKGTSIDALLKILKLLPLPERRARHPGAAPAPVWISSSAEQRAKPVLKETLTLSSGGQRSAQ
jgi:DNA-binding NtrC family response regulator